MKLQRTSERRKTGRFLVEGENSVAEALGTGSAAGGVFDLVAAAGGPTTLAELGMTEGDLDEAAHLATERRYPNPREVTRVGVRRLLGEAFGGIRPA